MNLDENGFRFSFSEAVILKEPFEAKAGKVTSCEFDVPPEVTITKQDDTYIFDFRIPEGKPAEDIFIDSEVIEGSNNPVSGNAVKMYVDSVEERLKADEQVPMYVAPSRLSLPETEHYVTLPENMYVVFPEMSFLSISLGTPADSGVLNEYRFRFTSGATPTNLILRLSRKKQRKKINGFSH